MKKDKIIKREVGESVAIRGLIDSSTVKDLGGGTLNAVISTNITDYHGEQIDIAGVDTSQYHGTVLYGHDYEGLPIGKATSLTKFSNKIKANFQLATDIYPFAKTVYDMIKGGYLTDVSIGGMVTEWSDDYKTIKSMIMKEFSIVPVGANHEALISMKSIGKSEKEYAKEYKDFVKSTILDKAKSIPDNELQETIKNLEQLLKHLTVAHKELQKDNSTGEIKKVKMFTLKRAAQQINGESARAIKIIKLKEV